LQTYARNGLVYTIERANGAMVGAKPYLDNVNWTKGIGTYSGLADPTSVAVGWDLIPPQRRGLLCSRRERPRHRADCSLSADRRHEILSSHSLIPPIETLSQSGTDGNRPKNRGLPLKRAAIAAFDESCRRSGHPLMSLTDPVRTRGQKR
jgi:hypothetical protein